MTTSPPQAEGRPEVWQIPATAQAIHGEMEMSSWLAQARAELKGRVAE